eukprot:Lankesteria_metandrocarpae@DN7359_c0_g1_i1.p1
MEGLKFRCYVMELLWAWLDVRSLYNLMLTSKHHWNWFLSKRCNQVFQQYFKQNYFEYLKLNSCYTNEYEVRPKKSTWQKHYTAIRERHFKNRKEKALIAKDTIEFEHEHWVRVKDMVLRECCFAEPDFIIMYVRIDKATGKPKIQDADDTDVVAALNKTLASCATDLAK